MPSRQLHSTGAHTYTHTHTHTPAYVTCTATPRTRTQSPKRVIALHHRGMSRKGTPHGPFGGTTATFPDIGYVLALCHTVSCCAVPGFTVLCPLLRPPTPKKTQETHVLMTMTLPAARARATPTPPMRTTRTSSHGCACHHSDTDRVLAAPALAAVLPTRWGGYHKTTSMPSLSPRHHTTHVLEKLWGVR